MTSFNMIIHLLAAFFVLASGLAQEDGYVVSGEEYTFAL